MTDARQQAALEEAIDNLHEALHHIKTTLLVLRLAEMDSQPDTEDLVNRVFAALAMTEAAHVDARRRRTERVEATGE